MLNLIKNEYAKIFHKKSTYILLVLLLLMSIGMPLMNKLENSYDDYYYAYISLDEEIAWAKEDGDLPYLELLTKCKELGLSSSDIYSDNPDWRYNALNHIYYIYWETARNEKDETVKQYYTDLFNNGIKYVEADDWKGYYQFRIDTAKNNTELSASEKELEIYQYQYMLDNDIKPGTGKWQEDTLYSYTSNKSIYDEYIKMKDAGEYVSEKEFAAAENSMLIAKYRLDNNINAAIYVGNEDEIYSDSEIYIYTGDLFNSIKNGSNVLIFIMIISIIIAGNIISKEFSQGTIKFLLINPVKRSKIFWSKYITVFTYSLGLTLLTFVLEFIISLIAFGPSELNTQLLLTEGGKIISHSGLLFVFGRYMLSFVEIFVAFTIAFMISSLFRNSALAISLSMIIYFVGSAICQVATMFKLDFFRYTIFAVQNMTAIVNGKSYFIHMTTNFAVTVLIVYIVLILLTAHDSFTKRNV